MIYFHKILPLIFSPLFISIILIVYFLISKKRFYLYLSLFVILLFSNTFFSNFLNVYVERPYVKIDNSDIKISDYIVVLSGDENRFIKGIELLKLRKAEKIIFTGGKVPWENNKITEGEKYKNLSLKYGIKSNKIIVTRKVQNLHPVS